MIHKAKDLEAPNVVIMPCGGTTFREKNRRLLYVAVSRKPSEGGRSCGQSESIRDIDLFVGTSAMDWQTSEVASPLPAQSCRAGMRRMAVIHALPSVHQKRTIADAAAALRHFRTFAPHLHSGPTLPGGFDEVCPPADELRRVRKSLFFHESSLE